MPKLVFKDVELTSTTLNLALIADENIRKSNEQNRVSSETTRKTDEATRKTSETSRVSAENTRITSENNRVSAENTRKTNETARQTQETTRQNFYNAYQVYETYSPTKAYVVYNKVTYQGGSYICITNTTGNAPSYNADNTWWKCIGAKGQDGTGVGDMVASVYDPQNKHVDVFEYADNYYNALTGAIESKFDKDKLANSDTVTEEGFAYDARRGKALRDDLLALTQTVGSKASSDHLQALDKGGTGATTASQARNNLGVAYGTTAGTVCQGNDSRLSDARTPLSHNQSASTITGGTFGGQVAAPAGTDYTTARIRNAVILPKESDPGVGVAVSYPNGTIIFVEG